MPRAITLASVEEWRGKSVNDPPVLLVEIRSAAFAVDNTFPEVVEELGVWDLSNGFIPTHRQYTHLNSRFIINGVSKNGDRTKQLRALNTNSRISINLLNSAGDVLDSSPVFSPSRIMPVEHLGNIFLLLFYDPAVHTFLNNASVAQARIIIRKQVNQSVPGVMRFAPQDISFEEGGETVTYESFAFQAIEPDEGERILPSARVVISNVDKRFLPYLENKQLGDARITIKLVRRSTPNIVENQSTYQIENVVVANATLTVTLSVAGLLERPACKVIHNERYVPGAFV